MKLYVKIGTGPGEIVQRMDKPREPNRGERLTVERVGDHHGEKPFPCRCTKIVYLGDTENLFLLELE